MHFRFDDQEFTELSSPDMWAHALFRSKVSVSALCLFECIPWPKLFGSPALARSQMVDVFVHCVSNTFGQLKQNRNRHRRIPCTRSEWKKIKIKLKRNGETENNFTRSIWILCERRCAAIGFTVHFFSVPSHFLSTIFQFQFFFSSLCTVFGFSDSTNRSISWSEHNYRNLVLATQWASTPSSAPGLNHCVSRYGRMWHAIPIFRILRPDSDKLIDVILLWKMYWWWEAMHASLEKRKNNDNTKEKLRALASARV